MKCHTIVCGTSKSKPSKKCYIIAKEKFYGTLRDAGIITEEEYKSAPLDCDVLAERYGIYVTDITKKRYSKDEDIPNEDYEEGLRILDELIEEHKPKRILFNGKTAGSIVRDWKNFGKVLDDQPFKFIVWYGRQP
jgi:uracil-DNA glycosylase